MPRARARPRHVALRRAAPPPPAAPLVAELERTELVELGRFTRAEQAAQLAGILGAEPEPALVERLFARTEGNALHTEELLAAGADGRGRLPATLRDALVLRVESLPADGDPLALAAVAHHWAAAGDAPRAFVAALAAADAAERARAPGEAAGLLEPALELWDRVDGAAGQAGGDRVALLHRTARAHLGARDLHREKTAGVHVSRILAKLDVRTRTEAAVVGHRLLP